MFAFNLVKKIGEGKYLADDLFIIERVRKGRALELSRTKLSGFNAIKSGIINTHGKRRAS